MVRNPFKRASAPEPVEAVEPPVDDNAFTAHNIKFDDGTYTISPSHHLIADHPRLLAAKSLIRMLYGSGDLGGIRIVDLGCLEGGYATEFARMGLDSTGIDVRESNIRNCLTVQQRAGLANLHFVKDDVTNIADYAPFNVIFCCGLLYHLEDPRAFIMQMGAAATDAVIISTHYAPEALDRTCFTLSEMTKHEGLDGRWYQDHTLEPGAELDRLKWASWTNQKSFWPTKEAIFHAMRDAGFDFLFEHIDAYGSDVLASMRSQEFLENNRATFVGLRTKTVAR